MSLFFPSRKEGLMRSYRLAILLVLISCLKSNGQYFLLPDTNFAAFIKSVSLNAVQGNLLDTNNLKIRSIKTLVINDQNIKNISGIQYFDSLVSLTISAGIKDVPALPIGIQYLKINAQLDTLDIYGDALKEIDVSYNKISYINHLPNGTSKLFVTGNLLHSIDNLNDSLVELWVNANLLDTLNIVCTQLRQLIADHNQITYIQHLPCDLMNLDVSRNSFTEIANLPLHLKSAVFDANTLTELMVFNNELTLLSVKGCGLNSFPDSLPNSLESLDLSANYLDSVFTVPATLKRLTVFGNNIKYWGSLSNSLDYLDVRFNQLAQLPDLLNLDTLYCNSNPLTCLPKLPETLSFIETSLSCIPNRPLAMTSQMYPLCHLSFAYLENNGIPFSCLDDTIRVLTNANSYLWNNGDTLSYVPGACRTNYSCEVVNSKNCYFKDEVNLVGSLSVTTSYSFNCNNCLDYAEVSVSGGTPPYQYDWDFDNGPVINHHLAGVRKICGAGNLEVTVTDFAGDDVTDSVVVLSDRSDGFKTTVYNPSCVAAQDGYILVEEKISGSIPITVYELSHLGIGNYVFPVTTAQGCTDTLKIDLVADEICYTASVTDAVCGVCNGSVTASLNGENANSLVQVIVADASGNYYSPYDLCLNQMYICTFLAGDSSLMVEVDVDTLLQAQSSCSAVYPGDANNDGVANNLDLLSIGIAYNDTGTTRVDTSVTWTSHYVMNWQDDFFDFVNYKNADCNGDGLVNADDTTAISLNYNQYHFRPTQYYFTIGVPTLNFDFPDTLLSDYSYSFPLDLGSSADSAIDFYGLSFSVKYDIDVINKHEIGFVVDSCWFGQNGSDLIFIQHNDTIAGALDVGITRINHSNRSGFGTIGAVKFKTNKIVNAVVMHTGTFNVTGISASELFLPVNSLIDSVIVLPLTCSLSVSTSAANSCSDFCGASIQLLVNDNVGGLHFDWSQSSFDSSNCIPVLNDTSILSSLSTGNYICIISDSLGCTETISASVVAENNSIEIVSNYHYESCTACDGFIDLSVSGGMAPYHYDWSSSGFIGNNPDTVEDLTNLCFYFNNFHCNISDSIGCISQYYLDGPICGFNYQIDVTNETCVGNNDGGFMIAGNNFPTFCPFSYIYDGDSGMVDASTPAEFTNLGAGTYPIILISPNTCDTLYTQAVIEHLPEPSMQVQSVLPYCGFCNGTATIFIDSSTIGTFQSFWWSMSGNTTTTDTNLCAFTDYEYNFNDLNNCFYTGVVNLNCDSTVIIGVNADENFEHGIKIIPNPNNGTFTFFLSKPFNVPATLSIINILGDCVYKQLIAGHTKQLVLDQSNLPSGMYLFKLTANDQVEQLTFIKE